MIPLDSQERGLLWSFTSSSTPSVALDAGAALSELAYSSFAGSASTAYFRVDDFHDCPACLVSRAVDLDTPEGTWRFLRVLQEEEDARRLSLGP